MAKDFFHQQAKNALIKDGWNITHDPLTIRISEIVLPSSVRAFFAVARSLRSML
ncbi:fdxN element excision controlling factor protein [Nostoc carneum NIES-2107]|nr:fdxN element excision controlling factor protein [Nostoc carneum NIES-2107]